MKKMIPVLIGIVLYLAACADSAPHAGGTASFRVTAAGGTPPSRAVTAEPAREAFGIGGYPIDPEAVRFSAADTEALGIRLRMSEAEVEAALGASISSEDDPDYPVGASRVKDYAFGFLRFTAGEDEVYRVHEIFIDQPGYPGPRGLEIGTSADEVVRTFIDQVESADDDSAVFYRLNTGSPSECAVPPSAALWRTDGGAWRMLLLTPESETTYADWNLRTIGDLEESFWFCPFYGLGFDFKNGAVSGMDISLGPLAE